MKKLNFLQLIKEQKQKEDVKICHNCDKQFFNAALHLSSECNNLNLFDSESGKTNFYWRLSSCKAFQNVGENNCFP